VAAVIEIAPDIFRISAFWPEINLQFNHFLIRDEEPLLFHAGLKGMFPDILEGVRKVIDPAKLRHISFSHFESDECGALNEWLAVAPHAAPLSGLVGAMVNLGDFSIRPPRVATREEVVETGRHRYRFIPTPHVPHGWDAGVLFEENTRTLFCSDLFHQWGEPEAVSESSIIESAREALAFTEAGPLGRYVPYTHHTENILHELAAFKPQLLATMHGSSFRGDGAVALRDLAEVWRTTLGPSSE
jgi:flavorubredoxin